MNGTTPTPRALQVVTRIEAWAHQGPVRAVVVRIGVSVLGPLVIVAGAAMLVLPGPGLVVMALGAALLALEYEWARLFMGFIGRTLDRARRAAIPPEATMVRRSLGVATTVAFLIVTTGITAAITTYVGATLA